MRDPDDEDEAKLLKSKEREAAMVSNNITLLTICHEIWGYSPNAGKNALNSIDEVLNANNARGDVGADDERDDAKREIALAAPAVDVKNNVLPGTIRATLKRPDTPSVLEASSTTSQLLTKSSKLEQSSGKVSTIT